MKIQISLSAYIEDTHIGQVLQKYKGKGYYVHFTCFPKLGVKSTKIHADPLGIYFYPVDWILKSDGRINQHGEKQSLYSQYGSTYPYYYIVDIDKSYSGINLSNMSDEEAVALAKKYGVYDVSRFSSRTRIPASMLYSALRDANINDKKPLDKSINWIEDEDGVINAHEPVQILVRNPKIIKVIDFGFTKVDRRLSSLLNLIKKNIGEPSKVRNTVSKGRVVQLKIYYELNGYRPFVINLYEVPSYSDGYEIKIETLYTEWAISKYLGGPAFNIKSNKFALERDDSSDLLIKFVRSEYAYYRNSNALAESSISEWKQEQIRKDIENFSTRLDPENKWYCKNNGIINKFLCGYIEQKFQESLENITSEALYRYLPLLDSNNFEVYSQDYIDFHEMPSKSARRGWKELKSILPEKVFIQMKNDFKSMGAEFLSSNQMNEIVEYLES